jgi:hypothetical protein
MIEEIKERDHGRGDGNRQIGPVERGGGNRERERENEKKNKKKTKKTMQAKESRRQEEID